MRDKLYDYLNFYTSEFLLNSDYSDQELKALVADYEKQYPRLKQWKNQGEQNVKKLLQETKDKKRK